MANVTVFTPGRVIGFDLPDDAGRLVDRAFIEGGAVTVRLDGRSCVAQVIGDVDPRRHSWTWEFGEGGAPTPFFCSDCGALAPYDGMDAGCEVHGYDCPPTVFDASDHVSACPLYVARPCVPRRPAGAVA